MLAGSTAMATPITFITDLVAAERTTGSTVTFFATVTETGGSTTFLNGDTFGIALPLVGDDTPFLVNFPLSLSPLQSVTASFLSVTVPLATSPGLYSGSFAILGGSSPTGLGPLATQPIAVNVLAPAAVPEPGEGVLLLLSTSATLAVAEPKGTRIKSVC
jgi:hypothetical protein